MSQIRLYVDEDAAQFAVVDGLRRRGVDVLTILETDMVGATDDEPLDFASSLGRSIYTLNVEDFCRLHSQLLADSKEHAGIIVIPRQRHSIGEKIRRISELIER